MTLSLPYDHPCPVIYDNDTVIDVYTDEYLMALASAGDIHLVGMVTSSSVTPYNPAVPPEDFESDAPPSATRLNFVVNRAHGVALARQSGFRHLPDPVHGVKGHLVRPPAGRIEDTVPLGSPGSDLIVRTAREATPDRPLVVVMGGQLTVAVDAYLLDPNIADRMVLAWLGGTAQGMNNYNGGADRWACYIALKRLRLVQFLQDVGDPRVPKARLHELPDTPLRAWMLAKQHPTNALPDERDADGQPAIALMRSDYVKATKRVTFGYWDEVPFFRDDPSGQAIIVTDADPDIATEEWWRAMKNPKAWGL